MNSKSLLSVSFCLACAMSGLASTVWLDELDIHKTTQDWGQPQKDMSVDKHPLTIGEQKFSRGLGTHGESVLYVDLKGAAKNFSASVGVDSEVKGSPGSIEFMVLGDGKMLWRSGVMHASDAAKAVNVNLAGVKTLVLKVSDGGDGISFDHADWAEAKFEVEGATLETVMAPQEKAVILTPVAPATPRINGADIFGVRPGHPVLFQIPATGERPMQFSASHLPKGLQLDAASGLITGTLANQGEFTVTLRAKNRLGSAKRELKIVCGNQIALTPPMGWNSWNCFGTEVSDARVRAAADAMVAKGLIHHGWTYINIDDGWEKGRDANGRIVSNEKFPDMKALADYVHSKGLKFGIYSSPGPKTCAGYEGTWQHEDLDAQQYADWGFDYLKYDWCSYSQVAGSAGPQGFSLETRQKPYRVMRSSLDKVPRDIVFALCQYGDGNVWEWGAQIGGNVWRTTDDITDTWGSMSHNGFGTAGKDQYAGPGHWNDPDMLVVGNLGWGKLRPTRLTPNEQYTHISLWCLLASPLLIGCDMSQMDDFTSSLLSNDEVLAVNQDSLGKSASRVWKDGDLEIWAKDMADGSKAVGLFNRGESETDMTVDWAKLGLKGARHVRDLWQQKDLGKFATDFHATVARHGVVLVKVR